MQARWLAVALLLIPLCHCQCGEAFYSVPQARPNLAARGSYAVGVRTVEISNPGQIDIFHFDKSTGKAPLYDPPLTVEVWYLATIPDGQQERTTYQMPMPGGDAQRTSIAGKALREAPPAKGSPSLWCCCRMVIPVRVTSSPTAAKTSHAKGKSSPASTIPIRFSVRFGPFPSTLLNRASDPLFTLSALEEMSPKAGKFLDGVLDGTRVAIVGYSMGGYGALASAGAGYDRKAMTATLVPGGYPGDWTAGSPQYAARLRKAGKAVVCDRSLGGAASFLTVGRRKGWREFIFHY